MSGPSKQLVKSRYTAAQVFSRLLPGTCNEARHNTHRPKWVPGKSFSGLFLVSQPFEVGAQLLFPARNDGGKHGQRIGATGPVGVHSNS